MNIDNDFITILRVQLHTILGTFRVFSYNFKLDSNLPTAGALVMKDKNNYDLLINPEYNDSKFLLNVAAHEVVHDLLQHIPRRINFLGENITPKQEVLWNLAADHVVNQILYALLEKKNCLSRKYKEVSVDLNLFFSDNNVNFNELPVELIYRYLLDNTEMETSITEYTIGIGENGQGFGNGFQNSGNNDNNDNNSASGDNNNKQNSQNSNDSNCNCDSGKIKVIKSTIKTRDGVTIVEDYKVISQSGISNKETKKTKNSIVNTSGMYELKEAMKSAGLETNLLDKELDISKHPLDLKNELQKYFSIIKDGLDDITFLRPSKINIADPSLEIAVPRMVGTSVKCLVAIDSSGSISDEEYKNFISIIYRNARYIQPRILVFDTKIHLDIDVKELDEDDLINKIKKLKTRKACGGTDFFPVFEKFSEDDYDVVLFFTDLYPWKWPPRPNKKILWIVKKTHETDNIQVPYGKVIYF